MRDITERFYFVSVYQSGKTLDENKKAHKATLEELKKQGRTVAEVNGCYNGVPEQSLLIIGTNLTEESIDKLAKDNKQESYLMVHYDGAAELVFSTGTRKMLGKMQTKTKEEAEKLASWSELNGNYFVVE
jgi:hypothetical protein